MTQEPSKLSDLLQALQTQLTQSIQNNTLQLNTNTLTPAGADIVSVFSVMNIQAISLQGNSIQLTPNAQENLLTLSGGQFANNVLGLAGAAVNAVFGVNPAGDTLTMTMSFEMTSGYSFQNADPSLNGDHSVDYQFDPSKQAPYFVLTTFDQDATEAHGPLTRGLNFYALLLLNDLTSGLQFFLPNSQTSLLVTGPVSYENGILSVLLKNTVNAPNFSIVGISLPGISAPEYALSIGCDASQNYIATQQYVSGNILLSTNSFPAFLIFPSLSSGWKFAYFGDTETISTSNLAGFLGFITCNTLLNSLPAGCPNTGDFSIDYFVIALAPINNSLENVNFESFSISVTGIANQTWGIANNRLSMLNINIVFELNNTSGSYVPGGYISANYSLTDNIQLALNLPIPLTSGWWKFSASSSIPMDQIGDISSILNNHSLSNYLPAQLGQQGGILNEISIFYDPNLNSLTEMDCNFSLTTDWEIIPGKLTFVSAEIAFSIALDSYKIIGNFLGEFNLGSGTVSARLEKDAVDSEWILSIGAYEIPLNLLSDMDALLGSKLENILPASIANTQITLVGLQMNAVLLNPFFDFTSLQFIISAQNASWVLIENILTLETLSFAMNFDFTNNQLDAYVGAIFDLANATFAVGVNYQNTINNQSVDVWTVTADLADNGLDLYTLAKTYLPGTDTKLQDPSVAAPVTSFVEAHVTYDTGSQQYVLSAELGSDTAGPLWQIIHIGNFNISLQNLSFNCEGSASNSQFTLNHLILSGILHFNKGAAQLQLELNGLNLNNFSLSYQRIPSLTAPNIEDVVSFSQDPSWSNPLPNFFVGILSSISLFTIQKTSSNTSVNIQFSPEKNSPWSLIPNVISISSVLLSASIAAPTQGNTTYSIQMKGKLFFGEEVYLALSMMLGNNTKTNFTMSLLPNEGSQTLPTLKDLLGLINSDFVNVLPSGILNLASDIALTQFEVDISPGAYQLAIAIGSPPNWSGFKIFQEAFFNLAIDNFALNLNLRNNQNSQGFLTSDLNFIGKSPLHLKMDLNTNILTGTYNETITLNDIVNYFIETPQAIADVLKVIALYGMIVTIDFKNESLDISLGLDKPLDVPNGGTFQMTFSVQYNVNNSGELKICLCGKLTLTSAITYETCLCYPFEKFNIDLDFPPPIPPLIPVIIPSIDQDRQTAWDYFYPKTNPNDPTSVPNALYLLSCSSVVDSGKIFSAVVYCAYRYYYEIKQLKNIALITTTLNAVLNSYFRGNFQKNSYLALGTFMISMGVDLFSGSANYSDVISELNTLFLANSSSTSPSDAIQLLLSLQKPMANVVQALGPTYNASIAIPAAHQNSAFANLTTIQMAQLFYTNYQNNVPLVVISIHDMAIGLSAASFLVSDIGAVLIQIYSPDDQTFANTMAFIAKPPQLAPLLMSYYQSKFDNNPATMASVLQAAYQAAKQPILNATMLAQALAAVSSYDPLMVTPVLLSKYPNDLQTITQMAAVLKQAYPNMLIGMMAQILNTYFKNTAAIDMIDCLNSTYGRQTAQIIVNTLFQYYPAIILGPALYPTYLTDAPTPQSMGSLLLTVYTSIALEDMVKILAPQPAYLSQDVLSYLKTTYPNSSMNDFATLLKLYYSQMAFAIAFKNAYPTNFADCRTMGNFLLQVYGNTLQDAGMVVILGNTQLAYSPLAVTITLKMLYNSLLPRMAILLAMVYLILDTASALRMNYAPSALDLASALKSAYPTTTAIDMRIVLYKSGGFNDLVICLALRALYPSSNAIMLLSSVGKVVYSNFYDRDAGLQNYWMTLIGPYTYNIPATASYNNKIYVFWRDLSTNTLKYNTGDDPSTVQSLQNSGLDGFPSAVVFNGKLYVFWKQNNQQTIAFLSFDGTTWTQAKSMSGPLTVDAPATIVFNNRLYIFWQGTNNDICYGYYDQSFTWFGLWQVLGPTSSTNPMTLSTPALAVYQNNLWLLWRGTSQNICYSILPPDGSSWSTLVCLDFPRTSAAPAVAAFADRLYVFWTGLVPARDLLVGYFENGQWSGGHISLSSPGPTDNPPEAIVV